MVKKQVKWPVSKISLGKKIRNAKSTKILIDAIEDNKELNALKTWTKEQYVSQSTSKQKGISYKL